jgi:hypothetical protein
VAATSAPNDFIMKGLPVSPSLVCCREVSCISAWLPMPALA